MSSLQKYFRRQDLPKASTNLRSSLVSIVRQSTINLNLPYPFACHQGYQGHQGCSILLVLSLLFVNDILLPFEGLACGYSRPHLEYRLLLQIHLATSALETPSFPMKNKIRNVDKSRFSFATYMPLS